MNNPRATLDEVLGEFGRMVGLPDLATDEQGVCILVFDERISVNLMADPHGHDVVIWRSLGELPETGTDEAMARLLRANLFWRTTEGATLSLMPDTNEVIMARNWPLPGIDVETLRTLVETMVEGSEALIPRVLGAGGEPSAADEFAAGALRV